MPKSPIITDPVQNIDSLHSQINAFKSALEDKTDNQTLVKTVSNNQNKLKFIRFFLSFWNTNEVSNKDLALYNADREIPNVATIAYSTSEYLNSALTKLPYYLFKLIGRLNTFKNEPSETQFSTNKITVQEFITLIDELDERLTAHQSTAEEGCMLLKISSERKENALAARLTQLETLKKVSNDIQTNAAYILTNSGFYYINKKENIYTNINLFPKDKPAIFNLALSIPADTPTKLSQEQLIEIYANSGHQHIIDTIDCIKENFSEFKRTVLPYLEARKMLINAGIDTSPTFLPLDYEANKTTFGESINTVSENLTQLKNNPEALQKVKTALEQEEAERVAAETRKQEAIQKAEEEKQKQEKEENLKQENQKNELDKKIRTTKTELLSKRTTTEKFIDWLQDHPKTTFGLSILGLILLLIPGIVIMVMYFSGKNSAQSIDNVVRALENGKNATDTAIEDLPSPTMKEVAKNAIKNIFPESIQNIQPQFKSPITTATTEKPLPSSSASSALEMPKNGNG